MASSSGMSRKRKYPLSEKTQQEMLDDFYNNLDEDEPCGFLAGCFPADDDDSSDDDIDMEIEDVPIDVPMDTGRDLDVDEDVADDEPLPRKRKFKDVYAALDEDSYDPSPEQPSET